MIKNRVNYFCLILFLSCLPLYSIKAQRLYDKEREAQAKAAVILAEEIINQSTFDKQLKNAETFAKRDFEVHFKGAKRQMEYQLNTFRSWKEVNSAVSNVESTLNTANFITDDNKIKQILADIDSDCSQTPTTDPGKQICEARTKLKELEAEVKASKDAGKALEEELASRLEQIKQIDTLVDKARTYFKSENASKNAQTAQDLGDVFVSLANSYINFTNKVKTIRNQPLNELRLILHRIAVETLQVEADHWKTVGEIKLRRAEEQKDLYRLVDDFKVRFVQIQKCLGIDEATLLKERLNITFDNAKKLEKCKINTTASAAEYEMPTEEIIAYLYSALYSASALAARGETPFKLSELRLAQEENRFSIRQSAVIARGYEIILRNGTKRLERYYAGGIKPANIALLIYSAATVAIPAVIAGK